MVVTITVKSKSLVVMKFNCFLIMFLVGFIVTNTVSQERFETATYIGINHNLIVSSIHSNPFINQKMKIGYQGGLLFRYISEPRLGIQIELNITQSGWKRITSEEVIYTRNLYNIELPLLTHISIGNKTTKGVLNFGPNISYNISDKINSIIDKEVWRSINNKLTVGINLGLGVSRKTKIGIFEVECRAYQGIVNVFQYKKKDTRKENFKYSKSILAGIGIKYLFNLKKK